MSFLYVIKKYNDEIFEIHPTKNFSYAIHEYFIREKKFDKTTHEIWLVELIKSKKSCYELNLMIQNISTTMSIPYKKYISKYNKNLYYNDDIQKLCNFLNVIDIKYNLSKLDVEKIGECCENFSDIDAIKIHMNDVKQINNTIISDNEYNEIKEKIAYNNEPVIVKPKIIKKTIVKAKKQNDIIKNDNDNDDNINDVENIDSKQKIINLFNKNVKGKKPELDKYDQAHNGKEGHWLEELMGIKHNASNTPDLLGYEMKKISKKISFGDWTPDIDKLGNDMIEKWWANDEVKKPFMEKYGSQNKDKNNRYSWAVIIKANIYNKHGQKLYIDENNNVFVVYNKIYDKIYGMRTTKEIGDGDIKLFGWSNKLLKKRVEQKFAVNGYFVCTKNKNGHYEGIKFGECLYYDEWLNAVKSCNIYFDSGTHIGNSRAYMQWRADEKWWNNRKNNEIIEKK